MPEHLPKTERLRKNIIWKFRLRLSTNGAQEAKNTLLSSSTKRL